MIADPKSRPPHVSVILVNPAAGHIRGRRSGGRRGRPLVEGGGRRRHDLQVGLAAGQPQPRNPLPTALNLLPVAGNPLPIGRNRPPNPAYPNEIGLVWVPRP